MKAFLALSRGSNDGPICPQRLHSRTGRMGVRQAFTLVELLAVIAVIAILAAIMLKTAQYIYIRTNIAKVKADMEKIKSALEEYRMEYGVYPAVTNVSSGRPKNPKYSWHYSSSNMEYFVHEKPMKEKGRSFVDPTIVTYQTNVWYTEGYSGHNYIGYVPAEGNVNKFVQDLKDDYYTRAYDILIETNLVILDPWGNEYRYYHDVVTGGLNNQGKYGYDLWSFGPDKASFYNGKLTWCPEVGWPDFYGEDPAKIADDITNWREYP
jgi:general secretion pathway protein G